MKRPCKQCPYKKDSAKGWLGECSNPEEFLEQLETFVLHPCHMTINDWDDSLEIVKASKCVGALQFMNNQFKLSRFPEIASLQKETGKNEDVFKRKTDFIDHHKTNKQS